MKDVANPITIIVPVYGDWPSLEMCIDSLQKHVMEPNRVMLVNDCGPEVDLIERNIKKMIDNDSRFVYHRNPENKGFVKTCNRAALELDETDNDILLLNSDTIVTAGFLEEMSAVLYANDKHGCVCPRSNNATIVSVPFRMKDNSPDREVDYALSVYEKIVDDLPRYQVTPVAHGFCLLTRRTLVKEFGLFDEVYGLGYGEENDYCQRVNAYGYSSVVANKAFVCHLESRSFTSEKKAMLIEKNEEILTKRYPYYRTLVEKYINFNIDPVDWFADVIAGDHSKTKVMINLYHVPLSYNGTSRNILSLLVYISKNQANYPDIEFTIATNREADKFFNLSDYGIRTIYTNEINELFHVGYCPSQIFHIENLKLLNKYCQKIVFSHLDIIGIRSNALLSNDFNQRIVFEDALKYSDKVITISDFTRNDTIAYYNYLPGLVDKLQTVYQGLPESDLFQAETDQVVDTKVAELVERGNYVLVIGNSYPHKFLQETIDKLSTSERDVIVVGAKSVNTNNDNIICIESGRLSDAFMTELKKRCSIVVFPSLYEGFGLPTVETSVAGKPLILSDTQLNREISNSFSLKHVYFFKHSSEVPLLIEKALKNKKTISALAISTRTMADYNHDLLQIVLDLGRSESYSPEALRERWSYFAKLNQYQPVNHSFIKPSTVFRLSKAIKRTAPGLYPSIKKYYNKFKTR